MTLRLRLVLALLALTTVGLGIFGITTYQFYARSQIDQLDQQLRESGQAVEFGVDRAQPIDALGPSGPDNRPQFGPGGRPATFWGEVINADGTERGTIGSEFYAGPQLAPPLVEGPAFTAPDAEGNGEWRVLVTGSRTSPGRLVVSAIPLNGVAASLKRLVFIEASAAAGLLILLAVGSWLILRRGLRSLEHMAVSARSITAGDLSQRVEPAEGRTEVGQLGLALNTMLEEIEEAFAEREATEKKLRQFLADASHELRTPLTSIQGFAELFRVGPDHDHVDLEIILRRIEEESARMKDLVEDLLLLARLDETRSAERGPVDLTVLAADACSDAVALDSMRPVTLDAPEPVVVLGDQDHLRQAIANLVSNAVRHTPEGSPIDVTANIDDGVAFVAVRDHGPGLDDDAIEHVFDRFWQADAARVGKGAGLGLPIVAGIAHEHGGEITVANAEGGGAIFTLRFPLNAPT